MNRSLPILCIYLVAATVSAVFAMSDCAVHAADGLIRREGQFIELTTDLDSDDEINKLVSTFDAAVTQWVTFWNDESFDPAAFKVQACVMRDESLFRQQGLIPNEIPSFPFGYASGQRIWIKAQPSEYYTRHLVLHEGTHAYMFAAFDGAGTTWFQEGTAELLGLHSGTGQSVKVNAIPADRESVPYWGRFKRMDQLRAEGQIPTIETVMGYQPNLIGDVGSYAWSWAFVDLLQGYPAYRKSLLEFATAGSDQGPDFDRLVRQKLQDQWPIVSARWRLLSHDLDYGFDWSREQVELSMTDGLWRGQPMQTNVKADQGWQTIGARVPGGIKIRLQASGQITLAETTRPWISEPSGITLEYHRDRPLGQLLVCVLPNAIPDKSEFLEPLEIHAVKDELELEIKQYSWLLFRVNEASGNLSDNRGSFDVSLSVKP
ncbi:MAG: hypothetical protein L7U72_16310 [Rubripirellula sp.]|nr:hypothetical protein [Rubripirellula sp.]